MAEPRLVGSGWKGMDRLLMLELALGVLLFALAFFLYLLPAAREPFLPAWWSLPLLGGLFFGILALDRYRRRPRHLIHRLPKLGGVPPAAREEGSRGTESAPGEPPPRMDHEGLDPPAGGR